MKEIKEMREIGEYAMPVDLYIGPKKRGAPWWQGCLLSVLILIIGAYAIVMLFA